MFRRSATDGVDRQRHLVLGDRDGLPGQGRLVDLDLGKLQQTQVGRHLVTGLDSHQVTGHELVGREGARVRVAHDSRLGAHHRPQRVERGLGL